MGALLTLFAGLMLLLLMLLLLGPRLAEVTRLGSAVFLEVKRTGEGLRLTSCRAG